VAAIAVALLSTSCLIAPAPVLTRSFTLGDFCGPPNAMESSQTRAPVDDEGASAVDEGGAGAIPGGLSPRVLEVARAIGAYGELTRLARARAGGAPPAEIESLHDRIVERVRLTRLDLESAVAHIECEEGRALRIAIALRDAEADQVRRLTAYSLVLSALGAVASGTLDLIDKKTTASSIVTVSSGIIDGTLGLWTLAVHRTARFQHPRNVLGEVWSGEAHPDFPETVWAFMTSPGLGPHGHSVRDGLVSTWKESDRVGEQVDPARTALLFGRGGVYDADGLEERAGMLAELRDVIDLLNEDLRLLATAAAPR
jgi:hypothetical protein